MKSRKLSPVLRVRQIAKSLESLDRKRRAAIEPIERKVAALEAERMRIFEASFPAVTGFAVGERVVSPGGRLAVVDSYVLFYKPREGMPPKDYVGIFMHPILASGKRGKTRLCASAGEIQKAAS